MTQFALYFRIILRKETKIMEDLKYKPVPQLGVRGQDTMRIIANSKFGFWMLSREHVLCTHIHIANNLF